MTDRAILACAVVCLLGGMAGAATENSTPSTESKGLLKAKCVLGFGVAEGTLIFRQQREVENGQDGNTTITGIVTGLTPESLHGWHIHELGIVNVTEGCTSAGGHYNPFNMTHGAPDSIVRHVGDLGNLESDKVGKAVVNFEDSLVSLDGEISVIGRTLVIHEQEDDLGVVGDEGSLATGNAGARIGCCEIEKF